MWFRNRVNISLDSNRHPGSGLGFKRRLTAGLADIWRKLAGSISVLLLISITLIPIGALIWLVLFTDTFVIQAITVTDARAHTIDSAKSIINEEVQRSPLGQKIFFVQTDLIEMRLLSELPQVSTAHAIRKLPGTLMVVLQEKKPTLLLFARGDYYLVDEAGMPYEEARLDRLPDVALPTVKSSDELSRIELGTPALAPDFVKFVLFVQEALPASTGANVAEIRIPSLAAREVHFQLDNNWLVRFDVSRDPNQQLKAMRRVTDEILSEDEKETLEYIDLRIKNKVYYKTRV